MYLVNTGMFRFNLILFRLFLAHKGFIRQNDLGSTVIWSNNLKSNVIGSNNLE